MTTDKKAYLGDILTGEQARAMIGEGLWRAIDLPEHDGAALVVWRMEEDSDTGISPEHERNARKLVAGFNVCEDVGRYSQEITAWYEGAQEEAEAASSPPNQPETLTPLQAAKEALAIAEASLRSEHGTSDSYLIASAKLEPVREAIKAAEAAQP